MTRHPRFWLILRLAVSIGILIALGAEIGSGETVRVLANLSVLALLVPLAVLAAELLIRSWNWYAVLRAQGVELSPLLATYVYLSGRFFGAFMPSSLSADAVRTLMLARATGLGAGLAAASILTLNVIGLLAVCLLALAGAAGMGALGADPLLVATVGVVSAAALGAVAWLLFSDVLGLRWLPGRWGERLRARLLPVMQAVHACGRRPRVLGWNLLLALANQLAVMLVFYAVARVLAVEIPFTYVLAFVPVLALMQMLPISVSGFGAEQGIFVFLCLQVGVPAAEAFSVSLLRSALGIVFSALCGVVYLGVTLLQPLRRSRPPRPLPELPL